MTSNTKVQELRQLIYDALAPLLKSKRVALFGLPSHGNIGDTYISMGELELIKELKLDIEYARILIDSSPLPSVSDDCTILLQGGGDFGDVWRGIQEARLDVLKKYKEHTIIVFPQTVGYFDESLADSDAAIINECRDLTICARDKESFAFLTSHFRCNVLLVPDMAFFIPVEKLRRQMAACTKECLYLKRIDKELNEKAPEIEGEYDLSDWPTADNKRKCLVINRYLIGISDGLSLRKLNVLADIVRWLSVKHLLCFVFPDISRQGVLFLSQYKHLYLTRMHSAILAVLLDKEFVLLNNSYNKNKNFYNTWLPDYDKGQYRE